MRRFRGVESVLVAVASLVLVAGCGVDGAETLHGSSSGGASSGAGGSSGSGGSSSSGASSSSSSGSSSSGASSTSSSGSSSGGGSSSGSSGSSSGGGSSSGAHTPGNAPARSAGCGKPPTLRTGRRTITSSGQSREYLIDVPADYDRDRPYRLIFGLHWMGGTMNDVATGQTVPPANTWMYFGLLRLDAPRSAIFVAPQGIGNGWANTSGRDTKLLDDIIAEVADDLCIDRTRVFAGGFSYGGMFSSTLACAKPDVYRALAPQNGSASCASPRPVAFLAIGSTDGTNSSLQSYARAIARANGCSDPEQALPIPTRGSRVHACTSFTGCPAEYPVRFCAFDEGHKSAPFDGATGDQDDGNKTWVPGEIWRFYTQF